MRTQEYKLPLSSSPEYNNNSIKAWFNKLTNYDLALLKLFNTWKLDRFVNATRKSTKYWYRAKVLFARL